MSRPSLLIQCPNPACLHSENALGRRVCDRCQTPLVYRYLWAVGAGAESIAVGSQPADRYVVVSSRIWLDTQPGLPPDAPAELPEWVIPYLHLHPYQLHIPTAYGFVLLEENNPILLLENAPLDRSGQPFPSLKTLWGHVPAVRQMNWLWQMLQLWQPLKEQGAVSSLLMEDNLRVEGWRVRLRELVPDPPQGVAEREGFPSLRDLAGIWLRWIDQAQPDLREPLRACCQQMHTADESPQVLQAIAAQLNQTLLEQAAQLPLRLHLVGATTPGPQRSQNEDACYPSQTETPSDGSRSPQFGLICDGIGGHAGGEVASHLALRSLRLQVQTLLQEVARDPELNSPEVVTQQLEAMIRVANNLIAVQNDEQNRAARQRMGTTLVLAVQLPQRVETTTGSANAHEVYLAHVGDSRAYWITPRYCHQLTVDDDVATREVRMGRALYRDALKRPDAAALTQALGTRDADSLQVAVQRFLIEEDGLLLLCSDGLSDNDRVEQSWESATRPLFKGKQSLNQTLNSWIELANQQNGHDNTSVVLMYCQVSLSSPQLFEPGHVPVTSTPPESELSEASKVLLYENEPSEPELQPVEAVSQHQERRSPNIWFVSLGLAVVMFIVGAGGIAAWRQLDPDGFQRTWERLLNPNETLE